MTLNQLTQPHVVIVGGGFGGLYTAQALKKAPVRVTLVDQANFHLFQPLLYQVATGGLSPADIASPLRAVLKRQKNTTVLKAQVVDIDTHQQKIIFNDGELSYDILVVATGVVTSYFGNDQWSKAAPGLKTLEDALDLRRRILVGFEAAERETDPILRKAWMTFVVVGGGPTGVEMAGTIAELAQSTLRDDFRSINPAEAEVLLLEGADRILPPFFPETSAKAADALTQLGVKVLTKTMVTNIEGDFVTFKRADQVEQVQTKTIVWAAGMKASPLGKILADRTGVQLDRMGRVIVEADLSIAGHNNIFVLGDLACYTHQGGKPLPGVAPVAMQQGSYLAKAIQAKLKGTTAAPFQYFDKGSLAVIGRNRAVAQVAGWKLSGIFAWLIWVFVHLAYLVEYDNRALVLFQWGLYYFTRKRGARLITGKSSYGWALVKGKGE